jgi:outer membrane protein TolC
MMRFKNGDPGWLTITLLAVVTLSPFVANGQESQVKRQTMPLTLKDAIEIGLKQNRDVLVAEQERYKADAQVGEARSGAFPQISLAGSYARFVQKPVLFLPPNSPINPSNSTAKFELGSDNSYVMSASLSQAVYSRKLGVALDIAHTYRDYVEQGCRATEQNVVLAVKKSFYGVLLAKQLVEANRKGLEVVEANLENVRAQYRHGTAAEFDLLRAEVALANTEPLVTSAENNLLLAGNGLKNLLALPLEQDIRVEGTFTFEDVPREAIDQARQDALTNNPAIVGLSLQESILEQNISIERANFFPKLDLLANYQWQTQDNTFQFRNYNWAQTLNVGLSLTFSLLDGFKTSMRTEQAIIEHQKLHLMRLKAEEGLRIQIQSAELKMEEARKRIEGQAKSIDQAEQAVRIAQTRYRSGVGTQLELLDTQVAMTRTRTNYAQAVYDYLVAKAEWDHAVGSPR